MTNSESTSEAEIQAWRGKSRDYLLTVVGLTSAQGHKALPLIAGMMLDHGVALMRRAAARDERPASEGRLREAAEDLIDNAGQPMDDGLSHLIPTNHVDALRKALASSSAVGSAQAGADDDDAPEFDDFTCANCGKHSYVCVRKRGTPPPASALAGAVDEMTEAEIDRAVEYVREQVKGTDREMKPPPASEERSAPEFLCVAQVGWDEGPIRCDSMAVGGSDFCVKHAKPTPASAPVAPLADEIEVAIEAHADRWNASGFLDSQADSRAAKHKREEAETETAALKSLIKSAIAAAKAQGAAGREP
jgi:hypothetical protein